MHAPFGASFVRRAPNPLDDGGMVAGLGSRRVMLTPCGPPPQCTRRTATEPSWLGPAVAVERGIATARPLRGADAPCRARQAGAPRLRPGGGVGGGPGDARRLPV